MPLIILADDMGELLVVLFGLFIQIGIPLAIIVFAMVVGSMIERQHYKEIKEREAQFVNLPAVPTKTVDGDREIAESRIVMGSVVISLDYFKRFLAGLRNIIGGRVRSYESLTDRGRREAILRMKEQFPDADIIINFRMETSTLARTGRGGKQSVGGVELLAYGTAIKYK